MRQFLVALLMAKNNYIIHLPYGSVKALNKSWLAASECVVTLLDDAPLIHFIEVRLP